MDTLLMVFVWITGLMLIIAFGLMAWKTWKTSKEIKSS